MREKPIFHYVPTRSFPLDFGLNRRGRVVSGTAFILFLPSGVRHSAVALPPPSIDLNAFTSILYCMHTMFVFIQKRARYFGSCNCLWRLRKSAVISVLSLHQWHSFNFQLRKLIILTSSFSQPKKKKKTHYTLLLEVSYKFRSGCLESLLWWLIRITDEMKKSKLRNKIWWNYNIIYIEVVPTCPHTNLYKRVSNIYVISASFC